MVPGGLRTERAAVARALMRRSCVAGFLVVLAVAFAACDGGGSESNDESTTTRGTDASTSTTEDTTSVTVGIICTSPEDAASTVVSAWTADDRAAAARCASETVVDELFTTSGAGNTWVDQGCDRTDPAAPVCAYSYEGGAAFLTTEGSDAGGWSVTGLRVLAD